MCFNTKKYLGEVCTMTDTEDLETDIDIDDIGTILKSSRLKSKKSMEEISSELCIRKIYLTALEEGDYETLPPIPYGVGYVRTYARYLGLNPERAVQLYKSASIREEPKEAEEEIPAAPEVNKSNVLHIIIGIIILGIIYGGWSLYAADMEQKAEATAVAEEEPLAAEEEPLAAEEEPLAAEEEPLAAEETIDADNLTDTENTQEENADKETANQASKSEKGLENKDSDVSAEAKATTTDKDSLEVSDNKVIFKFTGESWVEVKNKKKVYFQGVFHNGDVKEISYEPNLFVSIGRPQNLVMFIKGAKKQIISTKHKMNIPLDSIK